MRPNDNQIPGIPITQNLEKGSILFLDVFVQR